MPVSPDQLNVKFLVVPARLPLAAVHVDVKSGGDPWILLVVANENDQYAAVRLPELIEYLKQAWHALTYEKYTRPLAQIPEIFEEWASTSVDASTVDIYKARRLARESKSGRLVVLDRGQVIGVVDSASRTGRPADMEWLDRITGLPTAAARPPAFGFAPPEEVISGNEPPAGGGGEPIGAEPPPEPFPVPLEAAPPPSPFVPEIPPAPARVQPEAPPMPSAPPSIPGGQMLRPPARVRPPGGQRAIPPMPPLPQVPGEPRRLNVELEGHDPATPLKLDDKYTLAVFVDVKESRFAVATAAFRYLFKPEEAAVELTVYLSSEDFQVPADPQPLTVPAEGASQNRARFQVSPQHEGQGSITVILMKGANLIQTLTVKLSTGGQGAAVVDTVPAGRGLEHASVVKPRDVCLVFENRGNVFHVMMIDSVKKEADIRMTLQQLASVIDQARDGLRSIVDLTPAGSITPVYQGALDIPADVRATSLQTLARVGLRLFQQIFYDAGDPDATAIGDRLRTLASRELLKIQISSEQFVMPWGLLYLAEEYDPDHVDPDLFLGFKHIIEHIPLQQAAVQPIELEIDTRPHLSVVCGVDTDLDQQSGHPVTQNQLAYWRRVQQATGAALAELTTADQARQVLREGANAILYFYCHAISKGINDVGGPDASALLFTGFQSLTLGDLRLTAPAKKPLSG
ncbi:MAG: hypothetical protein ACM3JD_12115, partial [Rudaea sp.]